MFVQRTPVSKLDNDTHGATVELVVDDAPGLLHRIGGSSRTTDATSISSWLDRRAEGDRRLSHHPRQTKLSEDAQSGLEGGPRDMLKEPMRAHQGNRRPNMVDSIKGARQDNILA
jgi:hypothetical protein